MEITGDKSDLEAFIAVSKDKKFSLETYYPYETEDGEWDYNWCIENWGTKWDISEQGGMFLIAEGEVTPVSSTEMVEESGRVAISFLTAWSPPVDGIIHISGTYPKLGFKLIFAEAGNHFAGTVCLQDGDLITEEEGDFETYAKAYDFNYAY